MPRAIAVVADDGEDDMDYDDGEEDDLDENDEQDGDDEYGERLRAIIDVTNCVRFIWGCELCFSDILIFSLVLFPTYSDQEGRWWDALNHV